MNFFGFGPSAEVDIVLDGQESRKTAEIKTEEGKKEKHLLYYDGETVSGKVNIQLRKPGSRLDHYGIKVELIGQIELYYDRGNHHDFLSLVKELARPGDLFQHTSYSFEFQNVEKPYESYTGANVKLRYFLRVTIVRRLTDIVKEKEVIVHTLSSYPEMNSSIKMEVGIEDCLHIEFEYNKSKYHLKDVIVGKIYFLLVRIKIKHMEIAIIKRETTGSGPNTFNENETIAKYEIMDGAPVRGESIPIRVFLAGYELTPTMKDINKKFSVRYYLNLVLVDEEDRRYFKQQEIILWRKGDKTRKPFQASLQQQYKQMQNPNAQMTSSDQSITGSGEIKNKSSVSDDSKVIDVDNSQEDLTSQKDTDGAMHSREPLMNPEQPTPDKEFQSVINSGMSKSNPQSESPTGEEIDRRDSEPGSRSSATNSPGKIDVTASETKVPEPESQAEDDSTENQENEAPVVSILTGTESASDSQEQAAEQTN